MAAATAAAQSSGSWAVAGGSSQLGAGALRVGVTVGSGDSGDEAPAVAIVDAMGLASGSGGPDSTAISWIDTGNAPFATKATKLRASARSQPPLPGCVSCTSPFG